VANGHPPLVSQWSRSRSLPADAGRARLPARHHPGVARMHDANGLLIAFASFPAARCRSSASVAIRSGMLPSWLDAMSFDSDRMDDVPNRGKLAASWPSTPASAPPDGMQRLLNHARWDADQVRDDLRGYLVEPPGDPGAVLVVDETGFVKKGTTSVACNASTRPRLARSTLPAGGVLGLCQRNGAGVHRPGAVLPRSWTEDPARCWAARVPEESGSRPSRSWPESCWSAPWTPRCRPAG
jgi:hypothetical protein